MINQVEHRFRIKRVIKTSEEDYITALRIYNETTPYEIKTDTNEITNWINKKDEAVPFEIYAFILYLDSAVIGLSITTYIKKTQTIIDEYLAVKNQYRINVVFLTYLSLIQNYYSENSIDTAFYITEISNKDTGNGMDKESRISLKILCLEAFGKVDALYYALPLGNDNHESSFEAFLYIKTNDTINKLSKETYLSIVKSIYYDYYYNWYRDVLTVEQLEAYKMKIDHYYELIKKSSLSSHIPTIDVQLSNCSVLNFSDKHEKTHGAIPIVPKKLWYLIPVLGVTILVLPLLIIWGYNLALGKLGIPLNSISTMIGTMFSAAIASLTTIFVARRKS